MSEVRSYEDIAIEILDVAIAVAASGDIDTGDRELAATIASRDAEVRADERARVLAEFEWERAECADEIKTGHCHDHLHDSITDLEKVPVQVKPGIYEHHDLRPRRLVGPWTPVDSEPDV